VNLKAKIEVFHNLYSLSGNIVIVIIELFRF